MKSIGQDLIINTIKTFLNLKENWDSYGASPITKDIVDKSIKFVNNLPDNLYYVCPGPNNEIMLCYYFEDGYDYLEAEVYLRVNGADDIMLLIKNGNILSEENVSIDRLRNFLKINCNE